MRAVPGLDGDDGVHQVGVDAVSNDGRPGASGRDASGRRRRGLQLSTSTLRRPGSISPSAHGLTGRLLERRVVLAMIKREARRGDGPKTTKLYDRTADTVTVDEIERIVI